MPKQLIDAVVRSRRYLTVFGQLALVALSNRLAFALRFDGSTPAWAVDLFAQTLPWLLAVRGFTFIPFGLYQGLWRYASISDLQAILLSVISSTLAFEGEGRITEYVGGYEDYLRQRPERAERFERSERPERSSKRAS